VAEAVKTEQAMTLAGAVRVNNTSGEDYENTQVRLVVGVVRLVEEIAQLARQAAKDEAKKLPMSQVLKEDLQLGRRMYRAAGMGGAVDQLERRKEIVKEELSEYFLYTVEGRDTIPNGWGKRLPSFSASGVPITSYYKFEKESWGDRVVRFYRFTNSEPSKLGKEPLPDGAVKAFRTVTDDQLYAFVGRTSVKYIPVNETVELELGHDLEVLVKPTLMNWVKADMAFETNGNVKGWTTKETWEIEVQNSKDIPVVLDIRRNFRGDWVLATAANYESVDATKVKFVVSLKPREKQKFSYELTTRHGTNATR
jgi:hypothetical protein